MSKTKASKASGSSGCFAMIVCLLTALGQTPASADDQTMRTTYPNFGPSTNSSGQSPSYSGGSGSNDRYAPNTPTDGGSGFGGVPSAVRRLIGPGHLQSAAPNPATMPFQGGQSAQDAEHQRVMENMRRAGYSDQRIRSMDPYMHQGADPPGTTYRMINGIRVRNDGMTADQALNNVINNGTMNTPIHADYRQYQPGTYGYYRGQGGSKTYGQWLNGDR
jgi:hypothetical protein